jgi:hypothetical protein
MNTSRLAIAGLAVVASTVMIACSSDDNGTPTNTGNAPAVGDTSVTSGSLPIAETTVVVETTSP